MIVAPIDSRLAGRGLAALYAALRARLGGWALPTWLLCGLFGFAELVVTLRVFMPETAHPPQDGVEWILAAMMLTLCLSAGPLALIGMPVMFCLFGAVDWLTSPLPPLPHPY